MLHPRVAILSVHFALSGVCMGLGGCGRGESTRADAVAPVITPAEVVKAAPTQATGASQAKAGGAMHQVVLKDLDGKEVALSQFAGRPMIIEIWATWCGPCIKNRAAFHAAKKDIPDRVALLAASADTTSSLVKTFLKTHDSSGLELMATPDLYAAIKAHDPGMTIPKTVYVDSKGHVIDVALGTQNVSWIKAMSKNLR